MDEWLRWQAECLSLLALHMLSLTVDIDSDVDTVTACSVAGCAGIDTSVTAMDTRLQREAALRGEDHAPTRPGN